MRLAIQSVAMALRGAVVFGRQRPGQVPLSPSQGTRVGERRIVSVMMSGLGAADPASLDFRVLVLSSSKLFLASDLGVLIWHSGVRVSGAWSSGSGFGREGASCSRGAKGPPPAPTLLPSHLPVAVTLPCTPWGGGYVVVSCGNKKTIFAWSESGLLSAFGCRL